MNELKMSFIQYLIKLSTLVLVVFGALIITIMSPDVDSPIEWLGKYIGIPGGLLLFFWYCSLFFKARKQHIILKKDCLIINGRELLLENIVKVREVTHTLKPFHAWCPGLTVETLNGELINYISYYAVKEKDIEKFSRVVKKAIKKVEKKTVGDKYC